MNYLNSSHSTSFQNRNLRTSVRPTRFARFTTEDESEGVELFLRGLLLTSLIVALTICNLYVTTDHSRPSVLPTHNTAVATTQPASQPTAEAL